MAASDPILRLEAEKLAASLPPLMVEAMRVADTVAQGLHGRRRAGPGDAFWQFRPYSPGDRPQSIDWRQTAKSQSVFVREMEWAAAQTLYLWRDASPSMSWRSNDNLPDKRRRAEVLLLALAQLLLSGGERVALLAADSRPHVGKAALAPLAEELKRPPNLSDLPPSLALSRHSRVVLLGDFLAPLDKLAERLKVLAGRGIVGEMVQVLDPAEESLPFEGRVRFEGLEGEEPWLLTRVQEVRQDYRLRLQQHRDGLAELCRGFGWGFLTHRTDQPAGATLLMLYMALAPKRGMQ